MPSATAPSSRASPLAEKDKAKGRSGLAETVARSLYKADGYKDEYEVARLYTDWQLRAEAAPAIRGATSASRFNLAPPLLAARDPGTGQAEEAHLRAVDVPPPSSCWRR